MKIDPMGTTLTWKSEDTISGDVVLDGCLTDETQLQDYLKMNLPQFVGWLHPGDIENVQILSQEEGQDWLVLTVDITPSVSAGAIWADRMEASEEWSLYHSL